MPTLLAVFLAPHAANDAATTQRHAIAPVEPAARVGPISAAAYERHIQRLRKRLPSGRFHIVLQKPFVVIGDEPLDRVEWRARSTIQWAVDRLKQDFFDNDPAHIIDIWLFKDDKSYQQHVQQLFGQAPTTPFGCYLSTHRALVMNIRTGGGTLVHEIVHPLMAANFPSCPTWFNEGLASLYEQCGEQEGHLWGRTNWRLPGLQRKIKVGHLPALADLCQTTTEQFYRDEHGTNYAQARYLCYYLQEKGLLRQFYHAFHSAVDRDPTGYETLQRVLGRPDMKAFQREWEAYVLGLRF